MFEIERDKALKNPIGPVRITMPAKVAYNRELFDATLVDILEELGCRTCFSGADCTFQLEREFVIDPTFRVSTQSLQTRFDSIGTNATVNIRDDIEAAFDLDGVTKILDQVLGELGCLACCSGFDITFRTELERLQSRQFNF